MEKSDWLLLSIDDKMEPIQIQKTLFKFAMESGAPQSELYTFVPYNWGPLCMEIYDDLRKYRDDGLIEFLPSGRGWNIYHLTEAGQAKRNNIRNKADSKFLNKMDEARNYVVGRNFEALLEDLYKEYPEYAINSLFKKD